MNKDICIGNLDVKTLHLLEKAINKEEEHKRIENKNEDVPGKHNIHPRERPDSPLQQLRVFPRIGGNLRKLGCSCFMKHLHLTEHLSK